MDKTEPNQVKNVPAQKTNVGFFKRVANWFRRLFS